MINYVFSEEIYKKRIRKAQRKRGVDVWRQEQDLCNHRRE